MIHSISNLPDPDQVYKAEKLVASARARSPITPPENMPDRIAQRKQVRSLCGEHIQIKRNLALVSGMQSKYALSKETAHSEKIKANDSNALSYDMNVKQYLKVHPEDAQHFGMLYLDKLDNFGKEDKNIKENVKSIEEKSLIEFLKEKPQVGERLGDKAMAFRIRAQITNLARLDAEYEKLLSHLEELQKNGGYRFSDRMLVAAKRRAYDLLFWVRDNPVMGGGSVIALITILKLSIVLFFLDEAHKKMHDSSGSKALPPALQLKRLPPPQYMQPQPMSMQQSMAYPSPYLGTPPSPLQTALSMPTA